MNKSLFEQSGGTYSVVSDYYIPKLTVPSESEYHIGVWGKRRLNYMKKHRRILYLNLLTSGKLTEHLREIDTTAVDWEENLIRQMAAEQGATEHLKAENQMLWVGMMNNIRHCACETVTNELIYD